jgi:Fe-S cluster assembly protein SufD
MTVQTEGLERVKRLVCQRQEPEWMQNLRLAALQTAERLPEQGTVKSAFRSRFAKSWQTAALDLFRAPDDEPTCPEPFPLRSYFQKEATSSLLFANGRKKHHYLATELARHGILFTDLSLAVRMFPKLVKKYFSQALSADTNKWVALQTALWTEGLFVYIPEGVRATLPLQAWWQRNSGGSHLHPRLLIVADANSDIVLLTGEGSELQAPALSLGVAEIFAAQGARVRVLAAQEHDPQMTRLTFWRAQVEREARVEVTFADIGRGATQFDLCTVLAGEGAQAELNAIGLGHGDGLLDLTMTARHTGRHGSSRLRGQAVLTDSTRADYRTVSLIEKGAVGTSSLQEERMLLLSPTAQGYAVPTLLIEEEEVRCDHALSVGHLHDGDLFYLMSRGLSEAEAKRLLLGAFLAPLAAGVPLQGLRTALESWMERKIRS